MPNAAKGDAGSHESSSEEPEIRPGRKIAITVDKPQYSLHPKQIRRPSTRGPQPTSSSSINPLTSERESQSNQRLRSQLGVRQPSTQTANPTNGHAYNPYANSFNAVTSTPSTVPAAAAAPTRGLSRMSNSATTSASTSAAGTNTLRTLTTRFPASTPFGRRTPATSVPPGRLSRSIAAGNATGAALDPFSRANQPVVPQDLRRRRNALVRECDALIEEYNTAVVDGEPRSVMLGLAARCRARKDVLDAMNNHLVDAPMESDEEGNDDKDMWDVEGLDGYDSDEVA